jgi:alpha,alpha-trehalase
VDDPAGQSRTTGRPKESAVIRAVDIDAVIFDMDGVVTDTATVHLEAWTRLFDEYLRERARTTGEPFRPFEADDYRRFVDGKPRYDGVRSFLASRGISLPEGDPSDPPDRETVCGLGNRKDGYFLTHLREHGVEAFPSSIDLVEALTAAGIRTAVISASRNLAEVLEAGKVADLFEQRVGGVEAEAQGLRGKPDPAVFLEAARRLGVDVGRAAVIEDAIAGVEAGRRGGFGLVIGVDRTDHAADLLAAGADAVVPDLSTVIVERRDDVAIRDLPSALARWDEIGARLAGRGLAVFLDYDGTLTPIVERPEDAQLSKETRRSLEKLAAHHPVGLISGRDLADLRYMVDVDGVFYAGSHGFDITGPGGIAEQRAAGFLPEIDRAEEDLLPLPRQIPGARLERKRFGIAVHTRQVREDRVRAVEAAVDRVASEHPGLRKTRGKKVIELRPNVDWDKGRALEWLLGIMGLERDGVIPVYVGDDVTDEDAFRAIGNRGVGIVVRGEDDGRPTAASYSLHDTAEVREFLDRLARPRDRDEAQRAAGMDPRA